MPLPVFSMEALSYFDHTTAEGESGKERFQMDHGKSGMMKVQIQMVPLMGIRNQDKFKHYKILKANLALPLTVAHRSPLTFFNGRLRFLLIAGFDHLCIF